MKKIVLTGANGFLGSTITAQALTAGHQITPLVRQGSDISLLPEAAQIRYVDYSHLTDLETAFSQHQILIHNAGLTRALNWDKYRKTNIQLTEKLITIFNRSTSLEHFVFISSQAAAGPSTDGIPLTETSPCHPISMYGKSKLLAEDLIRKKIEGKWTIIRPASVFGPGDKDFLQIFRLIKKHLMLYPLQKEKIFSIIYSEDLARLILNCADNNLAYNEIFYATNREPLQQNIMVDYLEQIMTTFSNQFVIPEFWLNVVSWISEVYSKLTGKLTVINQERMQEFKLSNWQISGKKASQVLGFEPQFEIYEALHKTWQWYVQEGWL
jgi:nucleoside-diphosphate-sugar epimerase